MLKIDLDTASATPVTVNNQTGVTYYNIPCAYDIETSSFYDGKDKRAITYSHMFSINGKETLLRYNEEFQNYLEELASEYNTKFDSKHLVIYVHNLQYEFQFIKHLVEWEPDSIFVIGSKRRIVKAITTSGIEFRCSYVLTNKSLSSWAKDLGLKKMVGDLNYELVRTPETPLTDLELGYIYEDVRIMIAGLKKFLKDDTISYIPMTSTGFVRRDFRKHVQKDLHYTAKLANLTMDLDEYQLLSIAFSGGNTRANVNYAGQVVKNVRMWDENSEYPFEQCSKKFPMSKGEKVTNLFDIKQVEELFEDYCVLMTIELSNVETKRDYTIISDHKVETIGNKILDNGRIVYADKLVCTITELDYLLYKEYYDFEVTKVGTIYKYKKGYLPTPFVEKILELYSNKTTLKNVEGQEELYNQSKARLNGVYGMSVSSPIHSDTYYDEDEGMIYDVSMTHEDIESKLEDHNTSRNRFLFYPWGVWTTAYARYALMSLNIDLEDAGIKDYYCDTDSRYIDDSPESQAIIEKHNAKKLQDLNDALDYHNLDRELGSPVDPLGFTQTLGLWSDDEGTAYYDEFKTLGAKRYLCSKGGDYYLTVSGLTKRAKGYIKGADKGDFGSFFKDQMKIPDFVSGRKTLTYIEGEQSGYVTDYQGVSFFYNQPSCIHMERNSFKLTMSPDYQELIAIVQDQHMRKQSF